MPDEVTTPCDTVADPEDRPESEAAVRSCLARKRATHAGKTRRSVATEERRRFAHMQSHMSPTANRIRTAPLWGVRLRSRLMHDGEPLTLRDAIGRHAGEAKDARQRFSSLSADDQVALLTFLRAL